MADLLVDDEVDEAVFESNKGGRGFGRNVERLLKERSSRRCVIRDQPQTANNEARILASSAWVAKHVFMPPNWKHKYPEFYRQLANHQRKGRNAHDDAPDVLAAIYERVANPKKSTFRVRHA